MAQPNNPTLIVLADLSLNEEQTYLLNIGSEINYVPATGYTAPDSDLASLNVTIDPPASSGAVTILNVSGGFQFVPTLNFAGDVSFTFTATDVSGAVSAPTQVDLTVNNLNDVPVYSTDNASANAIDKVPFTYNSIPSVTDVDSGDTITYTLHSQEFNGTPVSWMAMSTPNVITGTPLTEHIGTNVAVIRATDLSGTFDDFTLTINVVANSPLTANDTSANIIVDEDAAPFVLDLTQHFDDVDAGDSISFSHSLPTESVNGLIDFISTNTNNMVTTFGANLTGTATIQITATDGDNNTATKDFTFVVNSVNDAPTSNGNFTNISGLSDTLNLTPTIVDLSGTFGDIDSDISSLIFQVTSNATGLVNVSGVTGTTFNVSSAGTDVSGSTTINVSATDASGDTTTIQNAIAVNVSGITEYISNTADITTLSMSFFNTAQRMQSITTAQMPALNSTQIGNMTSVQAAQLTTSQVADFSANVTPMHYSVYDSLTHGASSSDFLTGGAINFNANSLRSQQASTIKQFNKATLEALTPVLFKVLNNTQLDAFESEQMVYLDTTLLQVLDKVDASGSIVDFSTATSDRYRDAIQELSGIQITNLDATQVQLLSSASRLQWFNPTKLADMDSSVFGSIAPVQFDTFNAEQFAAFDISALSNMVQPQFDKLASSTNNLFANLTASQLQAIPATLFASGAVLAAHFSRLDTRIRNSNSPIQL